MSGSAPVRRAICAVLAIGIVAGCGLGSEARAQAKPGRASNEADVHFRRGIELYGESDFRGALVEFKRAHETLPNFRVLFNVAQTYYQLNDYVHALETFQRYLAEGNDDIGLQRRADVERDMSRLRTRVGSVSVTTNEEVAEVFIDDNRVGLTPARAVPVNAGIHTVRVTSDSGATAIRTLEVAGGDSLTVDLPVSNRPPAAYAPSPPTAPKAAPTHTPGLGSAAIAGWVATGTIAAGAAASGMFALGASNELRTQLHTLSTSRSQLNSLDSRVRTLGLTTDILSVVAVVTAATSVYFSVANSSPSDPKAGPQGLQHRGAPPRVGIVAGLNALALRIDY